MNKFNNCNLSIKLDNENIKSSVRCIELISSAIEKNAIACQKNAEALQTLTNNIKNGIVNVYGVYVAENKKENDIKNNYDSANEEDEI